MNRALWLSGAANTRQHVLILELHAASAVFFMDDVRVRRYDSTHSTSAREWSV